MNKSMSKLSGCLSALALLLALVATSVAEADTSYTPTASFATTYGSGDGEVMEPQHVAVETSTGNILFTDRGNNRVQVFAPDGAGSANYLTQFGSGVLNAPSGIAIDQSTGDVYVSDAADIMKFTTDGAPTPTYTQEAGFISPGLTGALAFDQGDDRLLVANGDHVRRYGITGSPGSSFDGAVSGAAFSNLKDIAVQDDGDVVVIDNTRLLRFKRDDSFAATLTDGPDEPAAIAAVPGTDNLLVTQNGGYTADFRQMRPSAVAARFTGDDYAGTLVLPTTVQGIPGLAVAADSSHQLYAVAGPGRFTGGDNGIQSLTPFVVQPPIVTNVAATPSQNGVRLSGAINPNNDQTSWKFEYGATTSYGKRYPITDVSIPPSAQPVSVSRTIGGLQPNTTYHYRLVATNGAGPAGADHTFTTKTLSAPPPEDGAGNGRAYEQVTPIDKQAGPVVQSFRAPVAAENAVAYFSSGGAPGAETTVENAAVIARRGADGWSVEPITPPQNQPAVDGVTQNVGLDLGLSPNLDTALQVSSRALAPGATEGRSNLYIRDNRSGTRTFVTTGDTGLTTPGYGRLPAVGSPGGHFVFNTRVVLTPDAVPGRPNAYEVTPDGQLRLVSRLSDGTTTADGGRVLPTQISADGRRIYFYGAGDNANAGPLYLRTDGSITVPVSQSQRPEDAPGPQTVTFYGASRDGSVAYFQATAGLLTPDAVNDRDVYRYDADTGELTNMTHFAATDPNSLLTYSLAVAPDGSRVYFSSDGAAAPGASGHNVYVADESGVKLITATQTTLTSPPTAAVGGGYSVSPNGRYFAFQTGDPLTGADMGGCGGTCSQLYVYDAQSDHLGCVTCAPVDGIVKASSLFGGGANGAQDVLDDGSVFFTSPARLVPGDANGVNDVYQRKDDKLSLISTGLGDEPAQLMQVSAEGKDVYFATAARLVAQDDDDTVDLYDARLGGGIPAQQIAGAADVAPCDGDTCQGSPSGTPETPVLGSLVYAGLGNKAAPLPSVSARPKLTLTRRSVAGTSFAIKVKVPGAGRIAVAGSGLRSVKVTAAEAATHTVKVSLTEKAKVTLKRARKLRVTAKVSFTPTGGAASSASVSVTLTQPKAKKSSRRATAQSNSTVKGR